LLTGAPLSIRATFAMRANSAACTRLSAHLSSTSAMSHTDRTWKAAMPTCLHWTFSHAVDELHKTMSVYWPRLRTLVRDGLKVMMMSMSMTMTTMMTMFMIIQIMITNTINMMVNLEQE
jgi:hypothetical protein